jgi:hypothetical protein
MGQPTMVEFPFRIEILRASDDRVEVLVAGAATFTVAHAAFTAAVRQYPTKIITLRNLTHVMARHAGRADIEDVGSASP